MRRWMWRLLADAAVALHLAFFTLLLVSPWFDQAMPLWAAVLTQVSMVAFVLGGLALNSGRCWVTRVEMMWRRKAYPGRRIRGQSLIRRLGRWLTLGRLDMSEEGATIINVAVLTALVLHRLWPR